MRVDIITTFPEMMESFFNSSIMGRAQRNGYAEICLHNLRDYTTDKHRKTDDYPFGGCAGLVMKIEPIDNCIKLYYGVNCAHFMWVRGFYPPNARKHWVFGFS